MSPDVRQMSSNICLSGTSSSTALRLHWWLNSRRRISSDASACATCGCCKQPTGVFETGNLYGFRVGTVHDCHSQTDRQTDRQTANWRRFCNRSYLSLTHSVCLSVCLSVSKITQKGTDWHDFFATERSRHPSGAALQGARGLKKPSGRATTTISLVKHFTSS